ncbi:MAG: SBBP repeat-containing protein [Labilithrix sp.]
MKLELGFRPVLLALLSLLVVGGEVAKTRETHVDAKKAKGGGLHVDARNAFSKQPMRFEPRGEERFAAHARNTALELDAHGAKLAMNRGGETTELSMTVAGGRAIAPVASEELVTKVNYLKGRDPSKWRTNVPTFGKVAYPSVLDGVDLVFHGEQGQLEYDFIVAPGADASKVAMNITGGQELSLTETGDLAIRTASGKSLIQERPHVYQRDAQGRSREIKASYRITGRDQIAFNVADYDHSQPLVIDPSIGYATFIGAAAADEANGITSSNGKAFIVGTTTDYRTWDPADYDPTNEIRPIKQAGGPPSWGEDAFVARLDPDGFLLNLTFLGGDLDESGDAIALDGSDNIYITGTTNSYDLPVTNNAEQADLYVPQFFEAGRDAYVAKLPADGGSLTYGTYVDLSTEDLQGTCPATPSLLGCIFPHNDWGTSIAVNGAHIYVSGVTQALAPFAPEGEMAGPLAVDLVKEGTFVVDLTNPASLVEAGDRNGAHFFGGGFSIGGRGETSVVAANNKVYVGGQMCDANTFDPVTPTAFQNAFHGYCDGFVAVLDEGTLAASYITLLGAEGWDSVRGIAVLPNGDVYATGRVGSSLSSQGGCVDCGLPPTVGGAAVQGPSDAFVLHLAFAGGIPSWLRLVGGADVDEGNAIAVDANSTPYITGQTYSTDFPTTPAGTRSTSDGEAFITLVAKDGSALVFSRYYGSDESEDVGRGIRAASDGIYLCGTTFYSTEGETLFPFPNTHTVQFGRGASFERDGFAARFVNDPLVLTPLASTVTPGTVIPFTATGGVGFGYVFTFAQNQSVATLSPATPNVSNYTAGINVGNDIVRVTDAAGNVATGNVTVFQGGQSSSSGTVAAAS